MPPPRWLLAVPASLLLVAPVAPRRRGRQCHRLLPVAGLQITFNNGAGTWANNAGRNYSAGVGTVVISNGTVYTVDPCTNTQPTPAPTATPTPPAGSTSGEMLGTAVHIPRVTWNRRFLPAIKQNLTQKYGADKADGFYVPALWPRPAAPTTATTWPARSPQLTTAW